MVPTHYMMDNQGCRHKLRIIIAFALQHWLHEHATMLYHTHAACLVKHSYSVKSQKTVAFRDTDTIIILKYNFELYEIRPVIQKLILLTVIAGVTV